ncbi:MAG: hypothetical protein AB8F94_08630 [Saprospiraceae bacterium]
MKTNSKIKTKKKASIIGTSDGHEAASAQHAANGKIIRKPDYSRMKQEIEKIKNPVSFPEIKEFYNVG